VAASINFSEQPLFIFGAPIDTTDNPGDRTTLPPPSSRARAGAAVEQQAASSEVADQDSLPALSLAADVQQDQVQAPVGAAKIVTLFS